MDSSQSILIGIPASAKTEYRDRVAAVGDTWLLDANRYPNLTVAFFYGLPDDYDRLAEKVLRMCRYAFEAGFDWMLKADDDTYIDIDRLMQEKPTDYAGRVHGRMCFGGSAFWLSRKSLEHIAKYTGPFPREDDVLIGNILWDAGIRPTNLTGHLSGHGASPYYFPTGFDPKRTSCSCAHKVRPDEMRQWYQEKHEIQCHLGIPVVQRVL